MKTIKPDFFLAPKFNYAFVTAVTLISAKNYFGAQSQRTWLVGTTEMRILIIAALSSFLAIYVVSKRKVTSKPRNAQSAVEIIEKISRAYILLALLGYAFWILLDPAAWFTYRSTGHIRTIAGVTTLTQFGVVGFSGLIYLYLNKHKNGTNNTLCSTIIILTVVRSVINNERLALIEIIIPILLLYFIVNSERIKKSSKFLISFFAFPALYSFFLIYEYFRSWQTYKFTQPLGLLEFTYLRLSEYYSTAINNGALYAQNKSEVSDIPLGSLEFLWNFPVLGSILFEKFSNSQGFFHSWSFILKYFFGTDEFNNIQSSLLLYGDFGLIGVCVVTFLIALIYTNTYKRMCFGEPHLVITYAIMSIGVFELPRIFWFGLGRSFLILSACLFLNSRIKSVNRSITDQNILE